MTHVVHGKNGVENILEWLGVLDLEDVWLQQLKDAENLHEQKQVAPAAENVGVKMDPAS